jgi:hypothetical protein
VIEDRGTPQRCAPLETLNLAIPAPFDMDTRHIRPLLQEKEPVARRIALSGHTVRFLDLETIDGTRSYDGT